MAAPATVILDKSFVQGAKAPDIQSLCAAGQALMPDVLFYEMISSKEPGRSRCFGKFPQSERPIIVVPNIGELLRYEFKNHRGSGAPSAHAKDIPYRFNPDLARSGYRLPDQARTVLDRELVRLESEVVSFIDLVNSAPLMFPDAFQGSAQSRAEARQQIEAELATPEPVLRLYSQLSPPLGIENPPSASEIDPGWALYRSLQVKLFATLDLATRYGPIPEVANGKLHAKMEHYMLDAQYAVLGALEGSLATRDNWMRDIWKKMCPDGRLM